MLDTDSTSVLINAIIEIIESNLFTQEPTPTALAPAANANGAVVVVIPLAVITGIFVFLVNSRVLAIETCAVSNKPLAPEL